ncbi:MAG: hypothetical protein ACK559_15325, partial [bacterium]
MRVGGGDALAGGSRCSTRAGREHRSGDERAEAPERPAASDAVGRDHGSVRRFAAATADGCCLRVSGQACPRNRSPACLLAGGVRHAHQERRYRSATRACRRGRARLFGQGGPVVPRHVGRGEKRVLRRRGAAGRLRPGAGLVAPTIAPAGFAPGATRAGIAVGACRGLPVGHLGDRELALDEALDAREHLVLFRRHQGYGLAGLAGPA